MSDEEYNKKLENLQKYIPFLDNMIAQLKDPSKKNREQQLTKMESLHAMITDRKRKLKLETLNKCEDVISKLYLKVNHKPFQIKSESFQSTPASPSPSTVDKDFFDIRPVPIPTERLEPESVIQKVDIYSSAAESLRNAAENLRKAQSSTKKNFDGKMQDFSKPPISLDDLKCLEVDVQEKINESASLKELNEIRNKIATELIFEKIKAITSTCKTDSNKKRKDSKYPEVDASTVNVNLRDIQLPPDGATPASHLKSSPKVVKEPSSIFGNILSTLDDKILEGNKKKDDRKSFITKDEKSSKSKDRRSSKEDKKNKHNNTLETSNSKEKYRKEKDPKFTNINDPEKYRKDKDFKLTGFNEISPKDDNKVIVKKNEIKLEDPRKARYLGNNNPDLKMKTDVSVPSRITIVNESKPEVPTNVIYKRLADKYNPKPRKSVVADVDKVVADSIEQNMKSSPPKIPVINKLTEPPPPPPPSLVKCSQLEPELPIHQPNRNNLIPPLLSIQTTRILSTPRANPSILISPRDNFLSPPHSSALMSPRDNFMSNTNPPVPMSPRDNFMSEYVREDLYHRRPRYEPQPSHPPPLMPPNNRFIPPNMNQRYNPQFNNYGQNHTDSVPPNRGPLSHQYNPIPPLLSPEVPHFNEQTPSFNMINRDHYQPKEDFNMVNRDHYLPKEDLRWRLEDNRPNWERRDFDPRFRGPMTYKEHREMRENSRDPRVARDPRESRERDLKDNKDIRDPRLNRDKFRDLTDNRDLREREKIDGRENKDLAEKEVRDPRLNKDLDRGRSRTRDDFRSNKFESKFDKMYSRTNQDRSRSRSRSSSRSRSVNKEKDAFSSPLDSLYTVKEEHKTGKGYGVQPFRIPKKKKDEKDQFIERNVDVSKEDNHSKENESLDTDTISDDIPIDNIKEAEASTRKETTTDIVSTKKNKNKTDSNEKVVNVEHVEDIDKVEDAGDLLETDDVDDASVLSENDVTQESTKILNTDTENELESTKKIKESKVDTATFDTETTATVTSENSILKETSKPAESQAQTSKVEESKPSTEQNILAQFFANLMGSDSKREKKTALYSLISTFSDSFTSKELSKISKVIMASNEDENSSEEDDSKKTESKEGTALKNDVSKKEDSIEQKDTSSKENINDATITADVKIQQEDTVSNDSEEIVPATISKRKLRNRRISSGSPIKENTEVSNNETSTLNILTTPSTSETCDKIDNPEDESGVLVTVGERIKSRKRNATLSDKPKKKSELDKLHEDIQEMFIRDGVLTASGKRMCHLLKDDLTGLTETHDNSSKEETVKARKKAGPKSKSKQPNESQVKAMKNVRVVIPKIPDATMEESVLSRRLTRSMTAPESDDESSVSTEVSIKEGTDAEDNESSDSEKESSSQASDNVQKMKSSKRKRPRSSWAAGIIRKKKKKQAADESSQEKLPESEEGHVKETFLTPNKDYYVDFISQKSFGCKLCDFQGRFITTHYKTVHPESEVISARLTPSIAAEAIKDAKVNMAKYEMYQMTKPTAKINYVCRFCTFSTTIVPTLFYDHLSTHTGEYRHICPNCEVSFCSGKTLKGHMTNNHKGEEKPIVRKSYSTVILFGYVCGECNYVQMSKKNIDDHINIYHLIRPPIHKINLSTVFDTEIEKLHKLEQNKLITSSENKPIESAPENIAISKIKSISPKQKKKKESLLSSLKDKEEMDEKEMEKLKGTNEHEKTKDEEENEKSLVEEQSSNSETTSKKSRIKIAPKSKKKSGERNNSTDSGTVSSSSSSSIRRSVDDLDPDKILPLRCKRAAKEKAQEKLKEIMEMNESLSRKKTTTDSTKDRNDSSKETSTTPVVKDKSINSDTEEPVKEQVEQKVKDKLEEVSLKPVKKEIDMNVFTCNTDIQEENKKIEQERLQKMDELNKSVGSRTSLNFVDKLCTRLNQNEVIVKQEPNDDFIDKAHQTLRTVSPVSMPVLEKTCPIQTPTTTVPLIQSKKPVLETESEMSTHTFDVSQKNDKSISDMIAKLKGKLSADDNFDIDSTDDYDHEGPPPLTHVNDLTVKPSNVETKTLEICGLVKVIKTDITVVFCCLVPPCIFTTENKDLFQNHCKENHTSAGLRHSTLCETCGVQINSSPESNLLENLFQHTIVQHADFIKIDSPKVSIGSPPRMLRIRKLSGDALSMKKEEVVKEQIEEEHVEDNKCSKDFSDVQPPADMINTNVTDSEQLEDNPFPFKIAGVMSLAEPQQQPPPLAPIMKQNLQIVVKEAKLTPAEIAKPRKTQKAIKKFLEDVGNLYKCPHYYCLYSTNFRDAMERHLKAHNTEKDSMIPCVYCDLKTPWEHVAIHIDIRHANCKFACSYCLYRACLKDYVFLHQDRVHSLQDYSVIALPTSKANKKFAIADIKMDPKTLCNPYKCTPSCHMKFLFENEFREHVMEVHKYSSFITCGHDNCTSRITPSKIVQHWSVSHGVSVYQCGYCRTNANELGLMYHHLSQLHQNLSPEILVRIATPKSIIPLGYSSEAFKRMRKIATLPNVTEGEKEVSKTASNQTTSVVTHFTNTFQGVTPTTNTKTMLTSCITTDTNSLFLVTNTPTTLSVVPVSPNPLLKPNVNLISSDSPIMVTSVGSTTEEPPTQGLSVDPLEMAEPPLCALTAAPKPSPTLPTAVENVNVSENANILVDSASTIPLKDTSPPVEEPTTAAAANVVPLEHVNLIEENNQDEPAECDVDPLDLGESITSQNIGYSSEEEGDKSKKKCGLLGYQLYRCAFCDFSCTNTNDFRKHASKSIHCKSLESMHVHKPYICVHCRKAFRNPNILSDHIQCHGILRFSCSICENKFATSGQARAHMKCRHNVTQTTQTPLNPGKADAGTEEYLIKPKLSITDTPTKENNFVESSSPISSTELSYFPHQIDNIPMRSIFSSDLKCAVCTYNTKVRTNMVRHLQFHSQEKSVPDTAPVNPVPCLEKNEKMFDKMINLASSSHKTGRMGGASKTDGKDADNIPEFVPAHTRYACCAQGCNYICPEEGNLRHHLIALHGEEAVFVCVHCKMQLDDADADVILKHLKLHGLQLYKCHHCNFVNNLKHKIEKHCSDVHVDLPSKVITVRFMESEPKNQDIVVHTPPPPVSNQSKYNKPWRCCMCKTKSSTQDGIQTHVLEKHEIDAQYKCALCAYKTNDKNTFGDHFRDEHSNQEINIIHVYSKIEEDPKEDKETDAFDTTPLWQRDRPRVRHIRGILFDETSPVISKTPKKHMKMSPSNVASSSKGVSRNLDLAIDAVASGSAEVFKDSGEDFIDQINKLMKSTQSTTDQNEDVIIIDDEDETSKIPISAIGNKRKSEMLEPETKKLKLEEFIDVESVEDELSEINLIRTFGDFGQPLHKQLKCPQCNKFKSKRISDFIFHSFKEKKLYRYKCGICGDESITYKYMAKHVKEHAGYPYDPNNVIAVPRNIKLEIWLQMLIRIQCVKIVSSLTPPIEVSPIESPKVLCRYCNKWFRSEQERNEHAIFHWNCIPFQCSECSFSAFTENHVKDHFKLVHGKGKNLTVIENGPTVAGELQYADFLHIKEVEEEINKLKLNTSLPNKAGIAEVLVPEIVMPDMIDESEQDGTVQGMSCMFDSPSKSAESPEVPESSFEPTSNVDDLVIVTKITDSNAPHAGDVYCCEYCPFMCSSEMLMLSHISGQHEHMHIKFKVLNKEKCEGKFEDYVACMICKEVGSEITIRQHFLEVHEGETFNIYRYTCCGCQKRFIKMNGLKMHFQRIHPGVAVKYTGILDNMVLADLQIPKDKQKSESAAHHRSVTPFSGSTKMLKHYKCTQCSYERDFPPHGIGNIRSHLRIHFKAFICEKCGTRWRTKTDALNHCRKEHPDMEIIYHDKDTEDLYQQTMRVICETAVPVPDPNSVFNNTPILSPSQVTIKQTARKSTSTINLPIVAEEYSYYGNPIEEVDLKKIMTSVDINGACLDMSAEKLGKIFDLNPCVYVKKCDALLSDDDVIEIDS